MVYMMTKKKKAVMPADFVERAWNESMTHVKTVVDMVSEPFLMLDMDLSVIAANDAYYRMFKYVRKDVEGKSLYALGSGEWDVQPLRVKLAKVSEHEDFFSGFQVTIEAKSIGSRTLMLNARNIQTKGCPGDSCLLYSMILLAMDDMTEMMLVAEGIRKNLL